MGWGSNPGLVLASTCKRLREIASAVILTAPSICRARILISYRATKKWRHRIKCNSDWSLQLYDEITWTTAMLSHLTNKHLCRHSAPHNATASTIGSSSFVAMLSLAQRPFQGHWIHLDSQTAPQPQDPEASVRQVPCHFYAHP